MSDKIVRSEVAFAVDADSEHEAYDKTVKAVKGAGFKVVDPVGVQSHGVSRLIDYIPGEFLVHVLIEHAEQEVTRLYGDSHDLISELREKGLHPHTQPGTGLLGPGDSRLLVATPDKSSLLNDSGQATNARNNDSQLVPSDDDPGKDNGKAPAPKQGPQASAPSPGDTPGA